MKKKIFLILSILMAAGWITAEPEISYLTDLSVQFGTDGHTYNLHLFDNETSAAIARHVGRQDWQLPIVGFEGFEHSNVMFYYDVPSRYIIPSTAERVNSQKAGEVYYSHPNRLVLFYHDAQVPGRFTRVGRFDVSDDFISAVEENPVLDGWDVMIIKVRR